MHCNYEEKLSMMWFLSLPVNLTMFSLSKILKQQRLEELIFKLDNESAESLCYLRNCSLNFPQILRLPLLLCMTKLAYDQPATSLMGWSDSKYALTR